MKSNMINRKSLKVRIVEQFVDMYIEMNSGQPPTYKEIEEKFKIKRTAAYSRCRHFRHKMIQHKKNN